jgi:hypothetical protein
MERHCSRNRSRYQYAPLHLHVLFQSTNALVLESHGNQSPPSSDLGSPVVKQLDPRDRLIFGKIPMNETPDLISCPKCSRPIMRHAVKEHLDSCGKVSKNAGKMVGRNEKDKANGASKGTPSGEIAVIPTKPKKRKHDDGKPIFTLVICAYSYASRECQR